MCRVLWLKAVTKNCSCHSKVLPAVVLVPDKKKATPVQINHFTIINYADPMRTENLSQNVPCSRDDVTTPLHNSHYLLDNILI